MTGTPLSRAMHQDVKPRSPFPVPLDYCRWLDARLMKLEETVEELRSIVQALHKLHGSDT